MGQNKGNLIESARCFRALGIILVVCGWNIDLRATRCDRSQLLEGIQPGLKLVGGLMRLVQALSGASELGPNLTKLTRTGCSCGEHLEESQLSLKLEGGPARLVQHNRGTQNLARVGR